MVTITLGVYDFNVLGQVLSVVVSNPVSELFTPGKLALIKDLEDRFCRMDPSIISYVREEGDDD